MLRHVLRGVASGAAGTAALNIATYVDIAIRGRASSDVPEKVAGALTQSVGIPLEAEANSMGNISDDVKARAQHRLTGLGALMGYATGLGIGALYGIIRPVFGRMSVPVAGLVLGAAAMATSDVPATITGATNPKTWGMSGWVADIVPHALFGLVTATAYEAYARD